MKNLYFHNSTSNKNASTNLNSEVQHPETLVFCLPNSSSISEGNMATNIIADNHNKKYGVS